MGERLADGVVAEGLGRLGAHQTFARRRHKSRRARPLQGVGDREGGNCARGVLQGRDKRLDVAALDERPRGVVDQHGLRRILRKGVEAGAGRITPFRATGDHRGAQTLDGRQGLRDLIRRRDDDQPRGAGRRQRLGRPAQHRLAGEVAPLLGLTPCAGARTGGQDDGGEVHGRCFGEQSRSVQRARCDASLPQWCCQQGTPLARLPP
jgi:hypothetical protein